MHIRKFKSSGMERRKQGEHQWRPTQSPMDCDHTNLEHKVYKYMECTRMHLGAMSPRLEVAAAWKTPRIRVDDGDARMHDRLGTYCVPYSRLKYPNLRSPWTYWVTEDSLMWRLPSQRYQNSEALCPGCPGCGYDGVNCHCCQCPVSAV
jgi:hypothetical protein